MTKGKSSELLEDWPLRSAWRKRPLSAEQVTQLLQKGVPLDKIEDRLADADQDFIAIPQEDGSVTYRIMLRPPSKVSDQTMDSSMLGLEAGKYSRGEITWAEFRQRCAEDLIQQFTHDPTAYFEVNVKSKAETR